MWSRRVIWMAAALAAVGVAAFAAWRTRFLWLPLPDPAVADTTGVVRWLVQRDIAAEPAIVQAELVCRVEELLDEPPSETVTTAATELPPAQLEQAQRNVELLKELWFRRAVERFQELEEPWRRWAFLDRQIERIERWMQWDNKLAADSASAARGSWSGFFAAIEVWAARANPALQARIWAAVRAGLIRWLGTTEVARQTDEARTSLALEIEKQIDQPVGLAEATDGFSPREEARFWRNVERLAEAWFRHQARRHAVATPREQARLVQGHLRRIEQFSPYLARLPSSGKSKTAAPESTVGGADFSAQVEGWIAHAPADEQPAMRQLAQHLAGAVLLKNVESFFRRS